MAKALKCDRCGKFYTLNEKQVHVDGTRIDYVKLFRSDGAFGPTFDLCDDCVKKLMIFLNYGKISEV